jgi:hypothetical protein
MSYRIRAIGRGGTLHTWFVWLVLSNKRSKLSAAAAAGGGGGCGGGAATRF